MDVQAGEELTAGRWDDEWEGWIWCINRDGEGGWVPESYLEPSGEQWKAVRDYTTRELEIQPGQELALYELVNGWYWAEDENNQTGWVPARNVERTGPPKTILFDLSEVLIAGLIGVEKELASRLDRSEEEVLRNLGGERLYRLCCGLVTEDAYLQEIVEQQNWKLSTDEIKQVIRSNFEQPVRGMDAVLTSLGSHYELALLSDHAAEWTEYILKVHPFLQQFVKHFFSYQSGETKQDQGAFERVIEKLGREPDEVLFIDDNSDNVRAARQAGLRAILFENRDQLVSELEDRGIVV
jgi:HAD superfamily hydrolase (TIGR01509 family)